jgi:YidC/Oxa1 family membrane protein insertase
MENKNFIVAIVLSVAIMFLWSEFFAPKPQKSKQKEIKIQKLVKKDENKISKIKSESNSIDAKSIETKTYPEKTGIMMNNFLKRTYSSKQGKISKILVVEKKYISKKLDMLLAKYQNSFFPNNPIVFSKEPDYEIINSSKNSVTFFYENNGIKIYKKITLGKNYEINVEKTIENNTGKSLKINPQIKFESLFEKEGLFNSYKQKFDIFVGYKNSEDFHIEDNKDVEKFLKQQQKIDWASINYAYFTFAFVNKRQIIFKQRHLFIFKRESC